MSTGWSLFVIVVTLGMLAWFTFLVLNTRRIQDPEGGSKLKDHEFDGITELDTPMPEWFSWMFLASIVFALVYLLLYPGLGNFPGFLGWTSAREVADEQQRAEAYYGPLHARLLRTSVEELARDPRAISMGRRLFGNYCAQCHGSDARGSPGYPNLTDGNWAWGGTAEQIRTTIARGRGASMPGWEAALGEDGVRDTVEFVLALADRDHDEAAAERGEAHFQQLCAACHGPDGHGNPALGAADLTAGTYLYGGSRETLTETVSRGRSGVMPGQGDVLDETQIHVLTAYVLGLPERYGGNGAQAAE